MPLPDLGAHWWLYLFLVGHSPIAIPGHHDSFNACMDHGGVQVAKFRATHKHVAGFHWCFQGGLDDIPTQK